MWRYICLALVLQTQLGLGQGVLSGQLMDEEKEPLAGANILVFQLEDSLFLQGEITDQAGSFSIKVSSAGPYQIECSYLGYESRIIKADTSGDLGEITLSGTSAQLEGVEVVAKKPMIQKELDRLIINVAGNVLSSGNSVMEILRRSPGVIVDQDDLISMSGRNGVRVYIDNKDTRLQGDALANLLRGIPASTIEKVELITNPSVKYEAQGNAGIINIVTKQGKFYGTNGSLTLSPGYGRYFRWENSLNFNHRTAKWNLYGQYGFAKRNQYMEIVIDRTFLDAGQPISIFDLQNDFRLPIENHTSRLGFDYDFSDRTSVGVLVSGFANLTGSELASDIDEFDGEKRLLAGQTTDGSTIAKWYQFGANLHFRHTFKGRGALSVDLDYSSYDNREDQRFDSQFLDEENVLLSEVLLTGEVDGFFDLRGLSVDYELELDDGIKWELGWKNTGVKTDNDLRYVDQINGIRTPNERLSNHFIYDEQIYAAYTHFRWKRQKWNASIGLRLEQTYIAGDQLTTGVSFESQYLNLFPSASFHFTANPKHQFGVSFSRRLDRPSYNDLNPFRFFVNLNTFRVGNPFLTPQYTWGMEWNYTYNQRYYIALNYGLTTDNLNRAIVQEGLEQVVVVKPINIDNLSSYALTLSFPATFTKVWTSQWNLNLSLNDFNGEITGFQFDRLNPVFVLNTNHSVRLPDGYSLQFGAFYLPPHWGSITQVKLMSQVSFGAQKRLWGGKGSLRLNFNDIFYQGYPRGRTQFGRIDDTFLSFRDTRFAILSLQVNFGKQSVKPQKSRRSKIQNELNRARKSNNG